MSNSFPIYESHCPIHGIIGFNEKERRVIDHPFFQRLRHISQLGFAQLCLYGSHAFPLRAFSGSDASGRENFLIRSWLRSVAGLPDYSASGIGLIYARWCGWRLCYMT